MLPKIKICGISKPQTIAVLNETKPDYVGFLFAESRRQVSPEQAAELASQLDPHIRRVGVFVNAAAEFAAETAQRCGLDVLQLHGDESGEYARQLKQRTGKEIWRAIRVRNAESLLLMHRYPADRFLLDAYMPNAYGGGGSAFCWDLLKETDTSRIILAGGLNSGNIAQAIRQVRPFGLDVSSGAETDGEKDPEKIREIIRGVRNE